MVLRLLILSDIHAGDSSFTPPLSAGAPGIRLGGSSWIDFADESRRPVDPLSTFDTLISQEDLQADYLVVPGDICERANGKALNETWRILQLIARSVGAVEIISTVGNHDLDSRFRTSSYDPRSTLRSLRPLFPSANQTEHDAYWANNFAVLHRDHVRFVIVNSCAFHETSNTEIDHGRITQEALTDLQGALSESSEAFAFNILICHHPPYPFPMGHVSVQDHMVNGENLAYLLDRREETWLLIHGHRHVGRVSWGPGENTSPFILSAGSFGVTIPAEHNLHVRNQAHLIELHTDVCPEVPLGGLIRSWDYTVDVGWGVAMPLDGLPAECGFGYRGQARPIATRVAQIYAESRGPVNWADVRSRVDEIAFLGPQGLNAVARILSQEFTLEILPSWDRPAQIARRIE